MLTPETTDSVENAQKQTLMQILCWALNSVCIYIKAINLSPPKRIPSHIPNGRQYSSRDDVYSHSEQQDFSVTKQSNAVLS